MNNTGMGSQRCGSMPAAASGFWRFAPRLYRIDRVPAVLIVVAEPAVNDDPCADGRELNAAGCADLGGTQRPTRVRQADTPASAVAPHPHDTAYDRNLP